MSVNASDWCFVFRRYFYAAFQQKLKAVSICRRLTMTFFLYIYAENKQVREQTSDKN